MTTDEILLKLGIDNTRLAAGLTLAKEKISATLGNGQAWADAGEKAGSAFAKAFHAKAIFRLGAFFLVFEMLRKLEEGFGFSDRLANLRLPGGGTWNAFGEEKEAIKRQEEVDKKLASFAKDKVKYKREEEKLVREIHQLQTKETDDQRELTGLIEKAMDSERAVREFKRGDGTDLDRLRLEKDFRQDLLAVEKKQADIKKEAAKEEKDAAKKALEDAKEKQRLTEQIADKQLEIERESSRYRDARDREYDSAKPSLQELAGAGFIPTQFNLGMGPGRDAAQHILYLDNLKKFQFSKGWDAWGRATEDQRNKEYDKLADRGMVPHRDKTEEHLRDIGNRIQDLGTEKHRLEVKAITGK